MTAENRDHESTTQGREIDMARKDRPADPAEIQLAIESAIQDFARKAADSMCVCHGLRYPRSRRLRRTSRFGSFVPRADINL